MENTLLLIAYAQEGDKAAKELLVEKNLGLVHHIVNRFVGRGYEREDLFQIGCIGLLKAIDRFDLSLGVQFSTYAVPLIMGEVKRFLRDDGAVKISRTLKENSLRIARVKEDFEKRLVREPTLEELEQNTGLSKEEVLMALESHVEITSIDSEDYVERTGENGFEEKEKEQVLNRLLVRQLMDSLTGEEQRLLGLRYFHEKTQTETAKILGIGQVQVSRKEKKILQKLGHCFFMEK